MKLAAAVAELEAAEAASPDTELTGTVSTLFFAKETFCTGRLMVRGREVKFSVRGFVRAGEPVTFRGKWINHAKFGRQFEAAEIVYTLPVNIDGLAAWLRWEGAFIGVVKAQKLVDEFGMDLTRLLTEDPQQVAACAGIPLESINELAGKWVKHSGRVAAASQLAAWGLTQFETETLISRFGGSIISILTEDPYAILGKVDGFAWVKVDALAAKIGVTGDDPRRLRGAVSAVVKERYGEGSTATPESVACDLAADKLGGNHELAEKVAATVDEAVEAGRFRRVVDVASGAKWLATGWAWTCEAGMWGVLATAKQGNSAVVREVACEYCGGAGRLEPEDIDGVELVGLRCSMCDGKGWTLEYPVNSGMGSDPVAFCRNYYGNVSEGVSLDDGQLAAVVNAARYRISVITGGAGAGKTLVARQITKFFTDGDTRVSLCAPTGKAARRLTEVIGRPATTIHRLLGWDPRGGRFSHNKENPLPAGVVLCDEASMLDNEIGYSLLSAIGPEGALVLIGDPNQLPPVGAGALLRDILAHDLAPTTRLEHCHRQAGTLKQNCNAILRGVVEPHATDEDPSPWVVSRRVSDPAALAKVVENLYAKYLPAWGLNPVTDAQFMTAMHKGKWGTTAINAMLQRIHQRSLGNELPAPVLNDYGEEDVKAKKRPVLYTGDKVIQTRNNYDLDVMNGTIGVVMATSPGLWVRYEAVGGGVQDVNYPKENEGEVSLAYCLSVHKMQGSEVPCAIVLVPKAHSFMQHRNWFYTATTRARRVAVIVGCDDGIRRAAERVENDKRATLLEVWGKHEGARPT